MKTKKYILMKKKSKFEKKMLTLKLYIYMKSAIKSNRNKKNPLMWFEPMPLLTQLI